jgi:hypothetical protein
MPFAAGDDKSDWSWVTFLPTSRARYTLKPDTVDGQLKRIAFSPNSVAIPALMPVWESYSWCSVRRINIPTHPNVFRDRRQSKVGDTKLRLQSGLADDQRRQSFDTFPVFKTHGHVGAFFEVHDGPDPIS